MRSAADMDDVGCPDPASSLDLTESTRSCWPNSCQNSTLPIIALLAPMLCSNGGRGYDNILFAPAGRIKRSARGCRMWLRARRA